MSSIFVFFAHLWIRVQVSLIRAISFVRFYYVRYKRGGFVPKPSLIEHIRIDDHWIRSLIYLPPNYSTDAIPYPLHIDFHGGGFIFGRPEDDAEFCNYLAREVNCIVASLSYRLAPEHPFPAAVLDAKAGVQYLLSSKFNLNINRSKISIGGFSAGGNLAIVTSSLIRSISALISFYPRTDFTIPLERKTSPGPDVTKFIIRLSRQAHLPPGTDLSNSLLSPMFADPDTLPNRILLITAEYDTSCAEGEAFAKKMQNNREKQVILWRAEKCVHGWDFMDGSIYENKQKKWEAYGMSSNVLKKAFYESNFDHLSTN